MKLSIQDSFSKRDQIREEILNGKLLFLAQCKHIVNKIFFLLVLLFFTGCIYHKQPILKNNTVPTDTGAICLKKES